MINFRVNDVVVVADQGLDQLLRLSAARPDEYPVARLDFLDGLRGGHAFCFYSLPAIRPCYPFSFEKIILASTTNAPSPSAPTLSGLISTSSISGKSMTSCDSRCRRDHDRVDIDGFFSARPAQQSVGPRALDHRQAFFLSQGRKAENHVLEHFNENSRRGRT